LGRNGEENWYIRTFFHIFPHFHTKVDRFDIFWEIIAQKYNKNELFGGSGLEIIILNVKPEKKSGKKTGTPGIVFGEKNLYHLRNIYLCTYIS